MSKKEEELTLEEQVARIRAKRCRQSNHKTARNVLNALFLCLAAIGLLIYFCYPEARLWGLGIIAVGMLLKIVELFLRFMY